jgi:proline dehydrogenase
MSVMRSVLLAGSRSVWLRERAMRWRFVRRSTARFMPGETMDEALAAVRQLQSRRAGFILTRLGENLASAAEAEAVTEHYLDLMRRLTADGLDAHISIKPTQLGLDLDPELCFRNLMRLVEHAGACGNFVWIDMESTGYVDRTLDLFRHARTASPNVGVCLQTYLRRSASDLEALLPLGPAIRLVKGAYSETPDLVYPHKKDVDENFFALACRLLQLDAQRAGARLAIGTHDAALVGRLRAVIAEERIPAAAYEFDMLFGIQRGLQAKLLDAGAPLRVLISYGEFWFPWYMRRLAERPANVWFVIKNMFASG